MQNLICGLILAATLSSGAQDSKNATAQPITWIFLNTGASRDKTKSMAKEAVAKMQSEHVGNFGKLFDQGRLFAAGPLGDNQVAWSEVVDWRRRPPAGGPVPHIVVLHGPDRRRLFVPLIYEESHALEVGLQQRGFPRY